MRNLYWSPVEAPSLTGPIESIRNANNDFVNSFKNLANVAEDYDKTLIENANKALLKDAVQYSDDPEAYKAFIKSAATNDAYGKVNPELLYNLSTKGVKDIIDSTLSTRTFKDDSTRRNFFKDINSLQTNINAAMANGDIPSVAKYNKDLQSYIQNASADINLNELVNYGNVNTLKDSNLDRAYKAAQIGSLKTKGNLKERIQSVNALFENKRLNDSQLPGMTNDILKENMTKWVVDYIKQHPEDAALLSTKYNEVFGTFEPEFNVLGTADSVAPGSSNNVSSAVPQQQATKIIDDILSKDKTAISQAEPESSKSAKEQLASVEKAIPTYDSSKFLSVINDAIKNTNKDLALNKQLDLEKSKYKQEAQNKPLNYTKSKQINSLNDILDIENKYGNINNNLEENINKNGTVSAKTADNFNIPNLVQMSKDYSNYINQVNEIKALNEINRVKKVKEIIANSINSSNLKASYNNNGTITLTVNNKNTAPTTFDNIATNSISDTNFDLKNQPVTNAQSARLISSMYDEKIYGLTDKLNKITGASGINHDKLAEAFENPSTISTPEAGAEKIVKDKLAEGGKDIYSLDKENGWTDSDQMNIAESITAIREAVADSLKIPTYKVPVGVITAVYESTTRGGDLFSSYSDKELTNIVKNIMKNKSIFLQNYNIIKPELESYKTGSKDYKDLATKIDDYNNTYESTPKRSKRAALNRFVNSKGIKLSLQ